MGILQKILETKEKIMPKKVRKTSKMPKTGNTADDILNNDREVERLSQYIEDKSLNKIINTKTGIKYGISKIGSKNDSNKVLPDLLKGASMGAKRYAAKVLVNQWAERNLKEAIKTKIGKEIIGKMISKNIYIKKVSYLRNAKTVSYLQARSIKTGQVVAYKTAMRLLGSI
jgi:hypothetical protein